MTDREILHLLELENRKAKIEGEIRRLVGERDALSNAIWRKSAFAKELAQSNAFKQDHH